MFVFCVSNDLLADELSSRNLTSSFVRKTFAGSSSPACSLFAFASLDGPFPTSSAQAQTNKFRRKNGQAWLHHHTAHAAATRAATFTLTNTRRLLNAGEPLYDRHT